MENNQKKAVKWGIIAVVIGIMLFIAGIEKVGATGSDDYMFFSSYWANQWIWKRRMTDGQETRLTTVNTQWNLVYNKQNDLLYYKEGADWNSIYSMKTDWTDVKKVFSVYCNFFSISPNWLTVACQRNSDSHLLWWNLSDWTYVEITNIPFSTYFLFYGNDHLKYFLNWNIYYKDLNTMGGDLWENICSTGISPNGDAQNELNYFDENNFLITIYRLGNYSLYKLNINDCSFTRLTATGDQFYWWVVIGNKLYYYEGSSLYSADLDGSNKTVVSSSKWYLFPWSWLSFSPNIESCNDGVLNQDETEIDYGGVCGDCSDWIQNGTPTSQHNGATGVEIGIDFGGRCTPAETERYTGCTERKIYEYSTGGTRTQNTLGMWLDWFSVTEDYDSGSTWMNIFGLWGSKNEKIQFDSWDWLNFDIFQAWNIQTNWDTGNPVINSGSLKVASGGSTTLLTSDGGNPIDISVFSMAGGVVRKFNYIKFSGVTFPLVKVYGAEGQKNQIGTATFHTNNGAITEPLVMSGGVAMAILQQGYLADDVFIDLLAQTGRQTRFWFNGLAFWVVTKYRNITECGNGDFSCKMMYEDPVELSICSPKSTSVLGIGEACVLTENLKTPVIINDFGDITIVTGTACIPNKKSGTITTPDGFQVDYTVDGSGNVINKTVTPVQTGAEKFSQECLTSNPGVMEYISCGFQFVRDQITNIGTSTKKTAEVLSQAQNVTNKNNTLSGSIKLGQSATVTPNNSLLAAFNTQEQNFEGWSSAANDVWKMGLAVVGAMILISIIIIFLVLPKGKKQS